MSSESKDFTLDLTIVSFDDSVISAYQRIPLHVVGNGVNTITELFDIKQKKFEKNGREEVIDRDDPRIQINLSRL